MVEVLLVKSNVALLIEQLANGHRKVLTMTAKFDYQVTVSIRKDVAGQISEEVLLASLRISNSNNGHIFYSA